MLMRYGEMTTCGAPQVGKIGSFVCACCFVLVFLVAHVGELTQLRPHTQMSQVEKH